MHNEEIQERELQGGEFMVNVHPPQRSRKTHLKVSWGGPHYTDSISLKTLKPITLDAVKGTVALADSDAS